MPRVTRGRGFCAGRLSHKDKIFASRNLRTRALALQLPWGMKGGFLAGRRAGVGPATKRQALVRVFRMRKDQLLPFKQIKLISQFLPGIMPRAFFRATRL